MIDPKGISCPRCKAPVGEPCEGSAAVIPSGVFRVHLARIQAASDAEALEPVADMSEEFQRDAEIEAEAERRYPSSAESKRREAFIAGAEWGSRPF